MRERVVFLPAGLLSNFDAGLRSVPAINTFLAELEGNYDVDIPTGDGQAPRPGELPTRIRDALVDGCHLVAMGWHIGSAMVALDEHQGVRSFVTLGFQPTPAMMRTAGMAALADAYEASILRRERPYAMIRFFFQGLDDETVHDLAAQLDRRIDTDRTHAFMQWATNLDLLKDRPNILAPTLYLTSRLDMGRLDDMFKKVIPHAEVDRLQNDFPSRLHDAESGIPPARQVIAFIQRHSA